MTDPSVTPDDIIEFFGLPVVRKLRTGSSGDGVSIIRSREELESLTSQQGDPSLYFYERYVDGRHIQFAGLVGAESGNHSVTYETLGRFASMGPASRIRVLDDEELRKTGLKVAEALDLCGMINVNVIRDSDGKDWVHDVNPRIWGSALSFRLVGVDFLGAYIAWLRGVGDGDGQSTPRTAPSSKSFRWPMPSPIPMSPQSGCSGDSHAPTRPFTDYLGTSYVAYESLRRIAMSLADVFPPLRRAMDRAPSALSPGDRGL